MYQFFTFIGFLPTIDFHIVWNRFTWSISNPCVHQFYTCLTIGLKFFWNSFSWAISNPGVCQFLACIWCLPTLELQLVRYWSSAVFNKIPHFNKFVTIGFVIIETINIGTHFIFSSKKITFIG